MENILDLKKALFLIEKSQEIGHIGSWELNFKKGQLSWSKETYRIFGLLPDEFGRTLEAFMELVHPDDRDAVELAFSESILNGRDSYEIEHRIIRKNTGEIRYLHEKCLHERDKSGTVVRSIGMVQDNTEHKLEQLALYESEERFRHLFETMMTGVVYQTADGMIISANPAAERILDLTSGQMQGKVSMHSVFPAIREDGSEIAEMDHPSKIALRTGKATNPMIMGVFQPRLNSYCWLSVMAVPLFLPGVETPSKVYLTFEDITERQKARLDLQESENRLNRIFDTMAEGVLLINTHGQIVYVNPAVENILGREKSRIVNQSLYSGDWNLFRMDGSPVTTEMMARFLETKGEKTVRGIKMVINRDNGGNIQVVGSASPLTSSDGHFDGFVVTILDNTELREVESALVFREQIYQNLLNNSLDAILQTAPDGTIYSANISACQMFGRSEQEICKIGRSGIMDTSDPRLAAGLELRARTGKFFGELTGIRGDGSKFPMEVSSSVFSDHHGKMRTSMIIRDITERKRTELTLQSSEIRLRELNATKDKFFSIIAHDLKTPFNTILGFSEILKADLKNLDQETIEKYIEVIYSSASNTFNLLVNLLEWSATQQGKIAFNPVPVSLFMVAKTEVQNLMNAAGGKAIELGIAIPEEILVSSDPLMLGSILRNLITNAIKFTPRNGKVNIAAEVHQSYVEISVADTGIGLKPEEIKNLFRIETSFTKSGTENEKGTGLGLIICKEFVEKHGGKIRVDSNPGIGTIFSFTIPKV